MALLYLSPAPDRWLLSGLREAGHRVVVAASPADALAQLTAEPMAVAIVDAGPDTGAWLRLLAHQAGGRMALLPAGAGGQRVDLIVAGADACLVRPFQISELLDGLDRLARQPPPEASGLSLNARQRTFSVNGVVVELTAQEFHLLDYLLPQLSPVPGSLLCRQLWGNADATSAESLKALIYRLRGKLTRRVGQPVLCSARGSGYFLRLTALGEGGE